MIVIKIMTTAIMTTSAQVRQDKQSSWTREGANWPAASYTNRFSLPLLRAAFRPLSSGPAVSSRVGAEEGSQYCYYYYYY